MKEADRFTRLSIDVLMVEDEAAFVELVSRMLADNRETEFIVHAVSTLAEAIEYCNEHRPAATLLDLGLPDSKGLGTVRHFVEQSAATALMILTALEDQHLAQEALALGAQEYLVKDAMTADLLARAIRYAVDRQGLINQLRSAREAESRERELRRVERLAAVRSNCCSSYIPAKF